MSKKKMIRKEAYDLLCDYQKWRRGEQPYDWRFEPSKPLALPYPPALVGAALDVALSIMREAIDNDPDKGKKPLRNKDVGTPEERGRRYHKFCMEYVNCEECPFGFEGGPEECVMRWEDANYESEV